MRHKKFRTSRAHLRTRHRIQDIGSSVRLLTNHAHKPPWDKKPTTLKLQFFTSISVLLIECRDGSGFPQCIRIIGSTSLA